MGWGMWGSSLGRRDTAPGIIPDRPRPAWSVSPRTRGTVLHTPGGPRSIPPMCGRFTETKVDPGLIAARFGVLESAVPAETLGRFNVCPTEPVLAVCGEGEARALRWGLVPPWARKLAAGYEPINARAETLLEKRLFAPLVASAEKRCLVVADGWYEWLKPERPRGDRIPFRYTVDGGEMFAFAGLWDERRVGGERVASVTLLTTV